MDKLQYRWSTKQIICKDITIIYVIINIASYFIFLVYLVLVHILYAIITYLCKINRD